MIRLKDSRHVPVASQIRDLLGSAGIEYACEYSLFGWHDALIRVWLTDAQYRRLLEVFPKDVRGMRVERIYYLWRGQTDLLAPERDVVTAITGAQDDIDYVADNPDATDSTQWANLYNHSPKLVFYRPATDGGVKFYTALQRTSGTITPDEQTNAIQAALNVTPIPGTDQVMSDGASLYCGDGKLGDYLVRCLVPAYDNLLPLVETFDENLSKAHVRPETLVVANPQPREYDYVNDPLHLSRHDEAVAELLAIKPRVLSDLDDHYVIELRKLVGTACKVAEEHPGPAGETLRQVFLDLLRATVLNSHDEWYKAIMFLAEFEPLFGKRVEDILALELGANVWFARIKEECERSPNADRRRTGEVMTNTKKAEWSLGTYKFLALAAAELHPAINGQLEREFGDQWSQEVDSVHTLRNLHLHGHKYDQQMDRYDDQWTGELRQLIEAAVLWRKIKDDTEA